MEELKLGQRVKIKETAVPGKIISIWTSLNDQPQYKVRYYDSTNRASDFWFYADDLAPLSAIGN